MRRDISHRTLVIDERLPQHNPDLKSTPLGYFCTRCERAYLPACFQGHLYDHLCPRLDRELRKRQEYAA